jgi:hypothetical protein
MQQTLDEEAERAAEKERNLDARILEITRLEARLYEALLQQEQKPQQEPQQVEESTLESDREHILDLRERVRAVQGAACTFKSVICCTFLTLLQELALARAKVAEKEKHVGLRFPLA